MIKIQITQIQVKLSMWNVSVVGIQDIELERWSI